MTEPIGAQSAHRSYSSEPEEDRQPTGAKPAPEGRTAGSAQLDAWNRMEQQYTPGSDGGACELGPMSYDFGSSPAAPEEPLGPDATVPQETYEQCVNREAREASVVGRWAGASTGCFGAAATVVPAGPAGMAAMCLVGGVGGYYAGGDAGATIGSTDGKVECDRPDTPGSPSQKVLEEYRMSAGTVPIKG